ncbi:hypothetical protein [Streptomyces yaizuensis]|uniref:Uncharacterized protein n=1 Tax=Streptomyces yaizuensis TaxID=2989713 RepID=A0AA86J3L8_9ACTN|nr:hypothetical protein [Streptomyces sp. YSPA8]BDT39462.1 hypothetical protein SYYSPA8_36720 [Streptomyces sp. YSPA8]
MNTPTSLTGVAVPLNADLALLIQSLESMRDAVIKLSTTRQRPPEAADDIRYAGLAAETAAVLLHAALNRDTDHTTVAGVATVLRGNACHLTTRLAHALTSSDTPTSP